MTIVVFCGVLLLFSIFCVFKAKKQKNKVYLYIAAIVFPFLGPLLVLMMLNASHKLFWQNSATKDQVWMTDPDSEGSKQGDSE